MINTKLYFSYFYYIFGWILCTIIFLLYIQYSPGMGNIWYRNNEYFSPMGAVKVILFPLQNINMWKPNMLDINYFFWLVLTLVLIWIILYFIMI